MNISIHLKNVRGNTLLKKMIERKTEKLEKMLKHYKSDMADITVIIEKNTRKKIFNSKIVLKLPTGTIISEKQGYSSFESIGKSFKSIFIEIKEHLIKLKHKSDYSKEVTIPESEVEEFLPSKTAIEFRDEILSNLARHIQYFIQYSREEIHILQKEYQRKINFILPEEIVDNAIILILEQKNDDLKSIVSFPDFEKEMYRTLKIIIKELVEDKISNQTDISVETKYKEPLISEDEIYDYYQPDTTWNLTDVLDVSESEMELETSEDKNIKSINDFIETLYPENRQIFYLHYLKKYKINEIETILRKPRSEIKKVLNEIKGLMKVNEIKI